MSAVARANRLTPYLFLAPAALVLIFALLYPIGYMIYASFLDWSPSQRIGQAEFVGLKNYINLLHDSAFHESFWVTIKFACRSMASFELSGVTVKQVIIFLTSCSGSPTSKPTLSHSSAIRVGAKLSRKRLT